MSLRNDIMRFSVLGFRSERARIQEFSSGGGGVQVSLTKKSSDHVIFFSPKLILLKSISKQSIIFQGSRGVPTSSRGQRFPGGGGIAYSL